jgi:hypothetical protein
MGDILTIYKPDEYNGGDSQDMKILSQHVPGEPQTKVSHIQQNIYPSFLKGPQKIDVGQG